MDIIVRDWTDSAEVDSAEVYQIGAELSRDAKLAKMELLRQEVGDCLRCDLCHYRKRERDDGKTSHIVFGHGDVEADLAVFGEGPGAAEEATGIPFVDFDEKVQRAGKILTDMLEKVINVPRRRVYVLNGVMCRAPDNRTPHEDEIEACRPFWVRQLEIVQPKIIIAMGRPAANALLGDTGGIRQLRGRWGEWRGIPVMPTFHPAYLLYQRNRLRARYTEDDLLVNKDLKQVRARFDEVGGIR